MCIMADSITDLASQSGISPEMAKKGLGMVLAALQHTLPADSFAKIEGAIPGAGRLLTEAQAEGEQSTGGILGSVKSMASKLFGGGDVNALASQFGQLGFSPDQVSRFLPRVLEFLRSKLPADLMQKITALLPGSMAQATR
jgi:hypothetical protein